MWTQGPSPALSVYTDVAQGEASLTPHGRNLGPREAQDSNSDVMPLPRARSL